MSQKDLHWSEDPTRLEAFTERLSTDAAARRNLDRLLIRLYHGRPLAVPSMNVQRPSQAMQDIDNMKASGFSLVREVGDAAAALVVRMPAMKVLPVGQQFRRQRGAKLMSRYLNGVFYANKVKRVAPALFNDEITTRMGALKVYFDAPTGEIRYERLNSLWLLWDDLEGPDPQSLYYESPASKRYLMSAYPKYASDIQAAGSWSPTTVPTVGFSQGRNIEGDRIKVTEAWSLPVGKLPGRHVIQVGKNVNLVDEKWDYPRFPVVPFRWSAGKNSEGRGSYGGVPLSEWLLNHQLWTNKIMRVMAQASKGAVPKLIAHKNSTVTGSSDYINELILWEGPGGPPTWTIPTTIGVDLWKLKETIKADAYELGGVNQAIAQGATSDNLKSAPAQRERMDIASTRLIHPTEGYEGSWREVGEVTVMIASDKYKNRQARVRAPGTRLLEEISWQDIDLREDEYALEVQSTAALPLTVGGRLDFVEDLMQMKGDDGASPLIKAKDGLKLLQIPDTEAILDRETAAQDLADYQVEQALWEGNYCPPEPMPEYLELLIRTGNQELMRALQNPTFPEENLELCRRLVAEATMLMKPKTAPMAPQTAPPAPVGDQVAPGPAPPQPAAPMAQA